MVNGPLTLASYSPQVILAAGVVRPFSFLFLFLFPLPSCGESPPLCPPAAAWSLLIDRELGLRVYWVLFFFLIILGPWKGKLLLNLSLLALLKAWTLVGGKGFAGF